MSSFGEIISFERNSTLWDHKRSQCHVLWLKLASVWQKHTLIIKT